jgi:formyltetrahydrofolate hydrolase
MIVEIKEKLDHKWHLLDISKLQNKSLLDYIADSWEPLVAAIYDDKRENILLIISNTSSLRDSYEKRGIPFMMAIELEALFKTHETNPISIIANVFDDGKVEFVKSLAS